jgi:hypothetical protein
MLMRTMASIMAGEAGMDMPYLIEVKGLPEGGYRLGAGIRLTTGAAAGRELYCIGTAGDLFACDGHGEANLERFNGVLAGARSQPAAVWHRDQCQHLPAHAGGGSSERRRRA